MTLFTCVHALSYTYFINYNYNDDDDIVCYKHSIIIHMLSLLMHLIKADTVQTCKMVMNLFFIQMCFNTLMRDEHSRKCCERQNIYCLSCRSTAPSVFLYECSKG